MTLFLRPVDQINQLGIYDLDVLVRLGWVDQVMRQRATAHLLEQLEQVALAQGDQPAAHAFALERQRWLAREALNNQAVIAS